MTRFDYIPDDPLQTAVSELVAKAYEQITGVKYEGDALILRPRHGISFKTLKSMATIKEPSEDQIQADFFSWLALHEKKYPELALFYAIPNGSHKSPAARGLFKRTGLKAGVPDVHLPIVKKAGGGNWRWWGLFIEFKSKKGVLSDAQKDWHKRLTKAGHSVHVCRSWTEAANVTIDYLGLDIPKL